MRASTMPVKPHTSTPSTTNAGVRTVRPQRVCSTLARFFGSSRSVTDTRNTSTVSAWSTAATCDGCVHQAGTGVTRWLLTGTGSGGSVPRMSTPGRVEPGLLDGLAQRCLAWSAVRRLEPPAGERDLPRVAAEAGRAPLQQHVEVVRGGQRARALELPEQDQDRRGACVGGVGQDARRVDAPVQPARAEVDELVARASDVRDRRAHPRARTRSPNTANAFSAAGTRIGSVVGAGGADRLDLVVGEVADHVGGGQPEVEHPGVELGVELQAERAAGPERLDRCQRRSTPAAWRPAAGRPSPSASAGRSGVEPSAPRTGSSATTSTGREPDLRAGPPAQPRTEREREELHAQADAEHGDVRVDGRREQRLLGGQPRVARSGRRRPCCRP